MTKRVKTEEVSKALERLGQEKEVQAEKKDRRERERKERERLEEAAKLPLPAIPKASAPAPKVVRTQAEPTKKSVHTQTEAQKPDTSKEVKNLADRLTDHVEWARKKVTEQELATTHAHARAETLVGVANSRIARVERRQEEHLQEYNRAERRKQPLLSSYFRLQGDILEGVADTRSNVNNRLQAQFVTHTYFQASLRGQVHAFVAEALAHQNRAPATDRVQAQAAPRAPKRPAPEQDAEDSEASTEDSERKTTPEGSHPRRRAGKK